MCLRRRQNTISPRRTRRARRSEDERLLIHVKVQRPVWRRVLTDRTPRKQKSWREHDPGSVRKPCVVVACAACLPRFRLPRKLFLLQRTQRPFCCRAFADRMPRKQKNQGRRKSAAVLSDFRVLELVIASRREEKLMPQAKVRRTPRRALSPRRSPLGEPGCRAVRS